MLWEPSILTSIWTYSPIRPLVPQQPIVNKIYFLENYYTLLKIEINAKMLVYLLPYESNIWGLVWGALLRKSQTLLRKSRSLIGKSRILL